VTDFSALFPVSQFPDRGTKWLLESPENVRELIRIIATDVVEHLDFSRIQHIPTTFVPDNLRKQEADVVFLIPYRSGESEREVMLYILIEHQSTPSPSMGFRVLFYMMQIWDRQRREWVDQKVPESQWRFRPILPVVFYTGSETWPALPSIINLMDVPVELERFAPHHDALFLDLKGTPPQELIRSAHPFGWVLRVIQKEDTSLQEIREALDAAIDHLETLPPEAQNQWEKLMYYLVLLIYHRRQPPEQQTLMQHVQNKVRIHIRREEVANMGQTAAQALIQEGRQEGREIGAIEAKQEVLVELMSLKFGSIPQPVLQRIQTLQDTNQLNQLIRRFVTADSLQEMGIE